MSSGVCLCVGLRKKGQTQILKGLGLRGLIIRRYHKGGFGTNSPFFFLVAQGLILCSGKYKAL